MNARRFDGRDDDDDPDLKAKLAQSGDPQPLRKPLERLIEHMGAPPVSVLTKLGERWPDLVGPALADATRPIELVDGVLVVGCSEPALAAQIGWMEAQIRDRFDEVFEAGQLERVVARVVR